MAVSLFNESSIASTSKLKKNVMRLYVQSGSNLKLRSLFDKVEQFHLQANSFGVEPKFVINSSAAHACLLLVLRSVELVPAMAMVIPGLLLFGPLLWISAVYAQRHAKHATATSAFRLQGHDVLASAKGLNALKWAPVLYVVFAVGIHIWLSWSQCGMHIAAKVSLPLAIVAALVIFTVLGLVSLLAWDFSVDVVQLMKGPFIRLNFPDVEVLEHIFYQREELVSELRLYIEEDHHLIY
jgi:hypothetical protein